MGPACLRAGRSAVDGRLYARAGAHARMTFQRSYTPLTMTSPRAFGLAALLVMSSVSPAAQAPKMKLGHVLRLTPSTTAEGSGAQEYRFQAERGSRKGQYLRVSTGDA